MRASRLRRAACAATLLLLGVLNRASGSPDAPARMTPDWIRQSVIYEVFPRQFSATGNFAGITARLDELKALGVDVLWLMPIHPVGHLKSKGTLGSPYAVQDYYAVNPEYGTKDDFRRLVDGAHARGMKVIIDIVANHTAWDSVMMAHPDYYRKDASGNVIPPHPEWSDVAALNYANPDTRRYMRDMMVYWVREFHLDGLRCDAAGELPTDFWEEARVALDQARPGLLMLAEASKPELLTHAFDVDYAWPMMNSLNDVLMKGAPASSLRATWEAAEQAGFPRGSLHMHMSDDHDESRATARYGWGAAQAASAILFTLDGVPLLYNGMEVGDATESSDPALFERVPVFWEPKGREAFRETYRQLIALRHAHPALWSGSMEWLGNSDPEDVVSFRRSRGSDELVTVVNLSNRARPVSVVLPVSGGFTRVLGSGAAGPSLGSPGFELPAFGWGIYSRGPGH